MNFTPSKGVFTSYVLSDFNTKMNAKKTLYDSIMANTFDSKITFESAKTALEKYVADEKNLKYKRYEFYVSVDLGELWAAGKDHKLWLHDETGQLLDFGKSREEIRNSPFTVQKTFEAYLENSPYVKQWLADLMFWFDGASLGKAHCRWFEASNNPEIWVSIQLEKLYPLTPLPKAE